jgi:hypothetical protein
LRSSSVNLRGFPPALSNGAGSLPFAARLREGSAPCWARQPRNSPSAISTGGHPAPFRIPVGFGGKKGLILPEQTRAHDKARLVKRMVKADAMTLSALLSVLRDTFEEQPCMKVGAGGTAVDGQKRL